MVKGIDHIAVISCNGADLSRVFEKIGMPLMNKKTLEKEGIILQQHTLGSINIEIVESLRTDGMAGKDEEGIHHIGFLVDDIDKEYELMKSDRDFCIETPIKQGAHSRIFFFRPAHNRAMLCEYVQEYRGECHV